MVTAVQIYDQGKLVRFRSHAVFLRLLGWSQGYTKTPHYQQKYGDETAQELWDRTNAAHARLMSFVNAHKPDFDPGTGARYYKSGRIIIYPEGYEDIADPKALSRLSKQALHPGDQMPDSDQSASASPVASVHINGSAPAGPVPVSAEEQLTAIRILDIVDNLILECGLAEGTEAAQTFKASITSIHIEQRRVETVNGDPDHWLVEHLNTSLKL